MIGYDLEGLDPTSRELARELLRGHPELSPFARREAAPGGGAYFVLELPAPSGEHGPLLVDTGDRGRVVVRLERCSVEFDAPEGGGRSSGLPDALALIEDFLAGGARLYACALAGRFAGCGALRDQRELHTLLKRAPRGAEVTVWSWDAVPSFYVASGPSPR